MRGILNKKLVSLFVVCLLVLAAVTGCGAVSTKEPVLPSSVEQTASSDDSTGETTGEESTTSPDGGIDGPVTGPTDESGENSQEPTGEQGTSDQEPTEQQGTTVQKTTEQQGTTVQKPTGGQGTTGQQTTTGQQSTTTKKPTEATSQQTTTQKQTTTQPTTTKKTATTTTTQKQTTTSSSGSSNLTTAEKMAKEIVDDIITSGMSDFQKAISIHDWLVFNLDYDFTYSHYYVEETLRDRTCVCQGYALTFEMMAEMAGLEVTFIGGTGTNSTGQTESHAWNQVKIDGKWYNVDVTWDDPASEGKNPTDHSGNRYDYFLVSDTTLYKDHKATSGEIKTCSSDYDRKSIIKYGANSGLHQGVAYVESAADASAAVKKAVEFNKSQIILWYYDVTLTEANMWNPLYKLLDGSALYPASCTLGYPPADGVVKYICNITPLSQWNKITVVTSASALTALIDQTFDSGATTLTVRYEPADGNLTVYRGKYGFSYSPTNYNGGKSMLMTITKS